jgi:hypothetical protein
MHDAYICCQEGRISEAGALTNAVWDRIGSLKAAAECCGVCCANNLRDPNATGLM